jgi:hypothetical protein
VPGRWPPRGWLVSAAAATDASVEPASADRLSGSCRADPSPHISPASRAAGETDDAASVPRVGGGGPWPKPRPPLFETPLGLLNRRHEPDIPPHHLEAPLTVRPTRGIDRQTREPRLAFLGPQRHGVGGLLHNRCRQGRSLTAPDGAGRPWPTAAGAWLGAQATAAEGKTTQARQPQPGGDRSPPWCPE